MQEMGIALELSSLQESGYTWYQSGPVKFILDCFLSLNRTSHCSGAVQAVFLLFCCLPSSYEHLWPVEIVFASGPPLLTKTFVKKHGWLVLAFFPGEGLSVIIYHSHFGSLDGDKGRINGTFPTAIHASCLTSASPTWTGNFAVC